MDVFGGHIVFLHSGERDHAAVLLTLSQMVCYSNLKLEIMINNVVTVFPTDEKTPYEQGENRMVIVFSQ